MAPPIYSTPTIFIALPGASATPLSGLYPEGDGDGTYITRNYRTHEPQSIDFQGINATTRGKTFWTGSQDFTGRGLIGSTYSHENFCQLHVVFISNNTDYRAFVWTNPRREARRVRIFPEATNFTSESAGFDVTNITSIEIFGGMQTGTSNNFASQEIGNLYNVNSLRATAGEPGNECTIFTLCNNLSQQGYLRARLGNEGMRSLLGVIIGNGATETHSLNERLVLYFDFFDSSYYFDDGTGIEINTIEYNSSANDVHQNIGCTFPGDANRSNVLKSTGASGRLTNNACLFTIYKVNCQPDDIFIGCVFDNCEIASESNFSNCTFQNSDKGYTWGGVNTLRNSTFVNISDPDGAVKIGSSVSLDSLFFSANTFDFYVSATTGTVTITVDANSTTDHPGGFNDAGYIAAKVNSAGATVVIAAPVQSYTRAVSGVPVGAAVGLFKRVTLGVADRSQFTLAAGNNSGNSTLVINEAIPNDTPASGFVRVLRDDDTEDRLAYSSWAGSTFTLNATTLPVNYSSGNGSYVGYLDVLGSSGGTETVNLEYVADRDVVLRVRLGSGSSRIIEISQNFTITNADSTVPVTGFADAINESS